jgi:GTP cyclohydrolase FolE2
MSVTSKPTKDLSGFEKEREQSKYQFILNTSSEDTVDSKATHVPGILYAMVMVCPCAAITATHLGRVLVSNIYGRHIAGVTTAYHIKRVDMQERSVMVSALNGRPLAVVVEGRLLHHR